MEHGRIARAGAAARHAGGEGGQSCRSTSSSSQLLGAGGAAVVLASLHSWGLAVLRAGRRRRRGGWRGGGGGYCMARGKAKLRLGGWGWSRELSTARGWSSHGSLQDAMKNGCKNPVGRASSFPQQHHKARQGFAATCVLAWPDPTRPIKALMGPCGPCAVSWAWGMGKWCGRLAIPVYRDAGGAYVWEASRSRPGQGGVVINRASANQQIALSAHDTCRPASLMATAS